MPHESRLFRSLGGSPGLQSGDAQPERSRRLVLLSVLLLNLLVVTLCAALLFGSWRAEVASAQSETLNDVRLTEQVASGIFDEAAFALMAVANQLERQLRSKGLDASALWSIVDEQANQVPEIQRIGVFDANGAQVCGVPSDRCQRLDVADRDYFRRLRDHPEDPIKIYGPYASRPEGLPALVLARALRLQDGGFAGVVIAVLPLQRLRRIVTMQSVGQGAVSLRTADMALLLRQPELQGPEAAVAGSKVSQTHLSAVAAAPSEGVYRGVTASDGIERVTAYRRLDKHPLYVIVGRDTSDFLAGWRQQAAWAAGFMLMFAGVSWQLARTTTISLRRQALALRLYDQAPCGYHTLDPQGTYLSVNATELAWLGCAREEVVGKLKPTDFFNDEGRSTFAANFPQLMQTGVLEGIDLDLIGRDGRVRRVLVNATAVRDARGVFLHSNSVMHDISALHEARTQLQALARQQGLVLDNELIGMFRLKDRRTVWKNRAMDRIFGYTGAEWDGMPSRTLYFDDQTHMRSDTELQAALQQGKTYRSQLPMRHKDGHTVWIDASGALLSDGSAEVIMMLVDITALKSAEEARVRAAALEAQNLHLRELNRLKNDFVSNMSHELRTPLNGILGYAQLLQAGTVRPDSPKYPGYIDRIVSSGQRLLGLIDQMLDYAKIEAGKMAFVAERISVPHALHEVVELLQARREARRVAIRVEVEPQVEFVTTDAMRLRQMLLALVDNAIKFSHEEGSVELLASAVDDSRWQVFVIDHGIGIAEVDAQRLFSPFVQLSTGLTKTYEGTGIGLALVRRIALAQGGNVEIHSTPGQGSTLILTLVRVLASTDRAAQR